jgi:hypothetical protein
MLSLSYVAFWKYKMYFITPKVPASSFQLNQRGCFLVYDDKGQTGGGATFVIQGEFRLFAKIMDLYFKAQ